jgi:hypothetical protein
MIRVKYSLGKTINLGNFQSARVDVGIEMDIDECDSTIDRGFTLAKQAVKHHLNKSINDKDWE